MAAKTVTAPVSSATAVACSSGTSSKRAVSWAKRRTSTVERRGECLQQHCRIVDALADRDSAQVEAAMRAHPSDVSENMLGRH
ncbi:FCD domain-containing protein [Streptomyces sp. NPDC046909]|uniref:FCD domain-containing protein n=1 Tax=Streptomyces sp. NPDC046909 TaxID=3155617 RepID=UPI0033E3BD60